MRRSLCGVFFVSNVAILLPARLASTRLPHKLLLDRSGQTVLEHTLARAREAQAASNGLISRIVVAADDEKLIAVAQRAGVTAVMTDPNHTSGTDRIAEAARALPEEIIVNLQADEPEIDPRSVLLVAKLLASPDEPAPMATLAAPIFDAAEWRAPNVVKVVIDRAAYALYFSRAPLPFVRDEQDPASAQAWVSGGRRVFGLHHFGLYAYRRAFLLGYRDLPPSRLEQLEKLEQLRALEAGYRIKVGLIASAPPGIDTTADYEAFLRRIEHG
jgi:3-deoxy-manno-octulosonate cytidylyltransferase (CMP-KDO synthetase)